MEGKSEGFLARAAQAFEIPGQAAGLTRIEIVGKRELRVENHKGILAYGEEEVIISGGTLLIKVRGSGLDLRAMTQGELLLTGLILSVELE